MDNEATIVEEWFHQYRNAILSFFVYRLCTRDVEDLVQETFVRAIRGLQGFRGDAQPLTWLLSIARNVAGDHARRTQRATQFSTEMVALPEAVADSAEEVAARRETVHAVVAAIAGLRKNYRDVVVLREILQLSAKEAGEVLGWTPGKVNVTLHRAHQALRQQFTVNPSIGGIVHERV